MKPFSTHPSVTGCCRFAFSKHWKGAVPGSSHDKGGFFPAFAESKPAIASKRWMGRKRFSYVTNILSQRTSNSSRYHCSFFQVSSATVIVSILTLVMELVRLKAVLVKYQFKSTLELAITLTKVASTTSSWLCHVKISSTRLLVALFHIIIAVKRTCVILRRHYSS